MDTSVWIETFRKKDPLALESVVDFDEVITCLPVIQEVLQGFRDERAYRLARQAMLALPVVESPMALGVFEEAAQLFRSARRQGLTLRSSVDCLVAACALRNGLTVLHRDRDYPSLARISALQERAC
ncbi:MAG: PIN domain-containing protein [Polyangia bacterium]|nr:PIN domain-containing protein [Polyangia bacterium]